MPQFGISRAPNVMASDTDIRTAPLFRAWLARLSLNAPQIHLRGVHVAEVFRWGNPNQIRMMMLNVEAYAGKRRLDGAVFLRGDTVCVVTTLLCRGHRYGVLTSQLRLAGAQADVLDWASGMLDDGDMTPKSAALRELLEETGTTGEIRWQLRANLGKDFTGTSQPLGVSEGGTDEGAHFFWSESQVRPGAMRRLQGRQAGVAGEEQIRVLIAPWAQIPRLLPRGGRPCAKATLGWLLLDHKLKAW